MCKSIQCIVGITEPAALQLQADLQAAGCKILCNVAKHDAYCQEIPERSPRTGWNTGLQIELGHGTEEAKKPELDDQDYLPTGSMYF